MYPNFETNFNLDLNLSSPEDLIEIRNPTSSGKRVAIERISVTSESGFVVFHLTRFNELATHGTGGDAPTEQTLFKWDPEDADPVAEIWTAAAGTSNQIVWPDPGNVDYDHHFQLDPSDAGDDDKLQPSQYFDQEDQIIIPEGCSVSITMPTGQAIYTVKVLLKEIALVEPPLHAPVLAASGVIKDSPGTLMSIYALSSVSTDLWLMTFDATSVPADNTPPVDVVQVPQANNGQVMISIESRYKTGMCWAASTTRNVLTISGGTPLLVRARYR